MKIKIEWVEIRPSKTYAVSAKSATKRWADIPCVTKYKLIHKSKWIDPIV